MNIACFKESSFLFVCLFLFYVIHLDISVPIISHLIFLGDTLFEYNNKPSNPKTLKLLNYSQPYTINMLCIPLASYKKK